MKRLEFGKELKGKGIGYMMYLDRRKEGKRRKVVILFGMGEEKIMEKYGFKKWEMKEDEKWSWENRLKIMGRCWVRKE